MPFYSEKLKLDSLPKFQMNLQIETYPKWNDEYLWVQRIPMLCSQMLCSTHITAGIKFILL